MLNTIRTFINEVKNITDTCKYMYGFRCSDWATSTFALSPLGEDARARIEVVKSKERKCEDATVKREDEKANAKERYYYLA